MQISTKQNIEKFPTTVKLVLELICKSNPFLEKPIHGVRFDRGSVGRKEVASRFHSKLKRSARGKRIGRWRGWSRPLFAAIFVKGSIEDPAKRWEPLSVRCTIRDEDTSRSRKCTRRGHSVPESRIPRRLLIHRGLLNVAGRGTGTGNTRSARIEIKAENRRRVSR